MDKQYELRLHDRYVRPAVLGSALEDALFDRFFGGTIGYSRKGPKLPAEGGLVVLKYNEVRYSTPAVFGGKPVSSRPLYTLECTFSKEMARWYTTLQPGLLAWNAPVDNFVITIPRVQDAELLDKKLEKLLGAIRRQSARRPR